MIVVTGGAGFIGSNLVAGLEARGVHDLVVCDRLGGGDKWRNIAKRELADIVAPERLAEFLATHAARIDTVFHMGAISATTETDADAIIEANFHTTLAIWDFCARHGVRLIYASSAATYGDGKQGFDDGLSLADLGRLRPMNAYGWSKHVLDRRVLRLVADGAPRPPQWVGLKFFNVYGPNEYHKGGQISVVLKSHGEIAAGGPAVLFRSHRPDIPDGGQKRDFIWVGDCVSVMLWLLDTPSVCGIFNVGTGRARSFADLAHALFAAIGKPARIAYIDTPPAIRDRYQYFTQAEMSRLRGAGYTVPFTELETGVARYVREFLAAPDRYV